IRLSSARWLRQLAKVERVEERRARLLDIDDQVRIAKLAPVDFFRPIAGDDLGDAVEPRLVDKKARIDCRRIGDDPQPQAGGTASIGHRLADIDDLDAADRAIAGEVALEPAPNGWRFARFLRHDPCRSAGG